MERVALGANSCWFKSGDAAFKNYRLAPELNSFSGRPRILIVPRKSPEARPLAVIQAEGQPARLAGVRTAHERTGRHPHECRYPALGRWRPGLQLIQATG